MIWNQETAIKKWKCVLKPDVEIKYWNNKWKPEIKTDIEDPKNETNIETQK